MRIASLSRGLRATALVLIALAALAGSGCGGGGSDSPTDPSGPGPTDPGPTDPGPIDPGPTDPGVPPIGPLPVGNVLYAVDLANNFLVFGDGSVSTLTQKLRITGLPILKRIVGITIRPADHKLYGIGTDSRVYTIDRLTAVATPVSEVQFSPKIYDMFDIHFAMALENNGDRVRLIAAESGGNWSISLVDGTAVLHPSARYAEGTSLAGHTPRLMGMVFARPAAAPVSARLGAAVAPPGGPHRCENLMYAIDVDEALWIAACDPDTGDYYPIGDFPEDGGFQRCGELLADPENPAVQPADETGPPEDGSTWAPKPPDNTFMVIVNRIADAQQKAEDKNKVARLNPRQSSSLSWLGNVPDNTPIQSTAYEELGISPYTERPQPSNLERSVGAVLSRIEAAPAPKSEPPSEDPRARCS